MKHLFLILLLLFVFNIKSQGLNGEIGFNNYYDQTASKTVVVDEYTYFLKRYFSTDYKLELVKTDTLENIVWSKIIETSEVGPVGYMHNLGLVASESGGVFVAGYGQGVCEMYFGCFAFTKEYSAEGNNTWTNHFHNEICEENSGVSAYSSGLSVIDGQANINYTRDGVSKVYTFDSSGEIVDSLLITPQHLEGIRNLSSFEKIAYKKDTLFGFDDTGETVNQLLFSSTIQDIEVFNDELFVLSQDSVFKYDNNLQNIEGTDINGFTNYSNLKLKASSVEFISHDESEQHIIKLNHDFDVVETISIPVALSLDTPKDFNDLHFSCAINYDLTEFQTIRQLDFSLSSSENVALKSTDIGIIAIEITDMNVKALEVDDVYDFKLYANVRIKNFGDKTLKECIINNFIGDGPICGHSVYFERFSDLNLAPDESKWLTLGLVHSETGYIPGDTVTKDLCIYTSHPNSQTDLNVDNDEFCSTVLLGYAGIEDIEESNLVIYPNPANNQIFVEVNAAESYRYEIIDTQGNQLKKGKLSAQKIDVAEFSEGVYFISLINEQSGSVVNKRFVKL